MDLHSRKLHFIQEFLRINSEELVDKLDQFLHSEKKKYYEKELKPMSEETFGEMIDQAENDAENGRTVDARNLRKDIDQCD